MLPASFNDQGLLPPKDYEATLSELRQSLLVRGPTPLPESWDAAWRGKLVDNLEILVRQLWSVGITRLFIDGSFVEKKDHPNDIDGYFECDFFDYATGDLQAKLNLLDEHKVWTWAPESRMAIPGFDKKPLPMWLMYRVELFPYYGMENTGIADKRGSNLSFPQAFRHARHNFEPKGIVQILPDATPKGGPR